MPLPATWAALCSAADVPAAVFEHFAPVLATSPANRDLLRRVCATAASARIDTTHDEDIYHCLEIDFGADRLRCLPPRDVDATLPASFRRILALHGRLQLVDAQVDLFHETFVEEEGWLDGTDLVDRNVFSPLRVYSDLYIYHPDAKTVDGEMALYFLDHEALDEEGPQPASGDLATIFLHHVSNKLTPGATT